MDPERALQAAILARLRETAALKAWLGESVRAWDQPPDDPILPYVAIARSASAPLKGEGGGTEHRITLTCLSDYRGAEEAKAVTALVREALDEAPLTLEGHRLVLLRVTYSDVFRATDFRTTFGVVRMRAVTEAAG